MKALADDNPEVAGVVLDNAPQNAIYISPTVQKDILQIFATKTRRVIREEIGNGKFCILVDES